MLPRGRNSSQQRERNLWPVAHRKGARMITLEPAGAADLDYIMATERLPGYEALVGRWERAHHEAAMADDRHAYFIARDDDRCVGFAILRDWASRERVTHLK